MTEVDAVSKDAGGGLVPTPLHSGIPYLTGTHETLIEALDYAATGATGCNFHDARANLVRVYPYSELAADAREGALRLIAKGVQPGDRVALIAETGAEFAAACRLIFGSRGRNYYRPRND